MTAQTAGQSPEAARAGPLPMMKDSPIELWPVRDRDGEYRTGGIGNDGCIHEGVEEPYKTVTHSQSAVLCS